MSVSTLASAVARAVDQRRDFLSRTLAADGACRVFSGPRDGLPGVFIDAYARHAVLMVYEGLAPKGLIDDDTAPSQVLDALAPLNIRGLYLKPFARDRSRLGGALPPLVTHPTPAAGDPAPEFSLIREGNTHLEVRMYDGLSTGLFLDQRANRAWVADGVARRGKPTAVLNTFAYTCAFSVAAAVAGATTTSVDVSGKYLDWGKRNFAHNALDPESHRFARMDTFDFLQYAAKKSLTYDLAILDPPSFGSGDKRRGVRPWSATADFARLVRETARIIRPGGAIFASTNTQELCIPGRLEEEIATGLARTPRWQTLPPPPQDFTGERGRFAARAFSV